MVGYESGIRNTTWNSLFARDHIIFLTFLGGNLCRNCGATHTQHDRRVSSVSSWAPWLHTWRCRFSSDSLRTLLQAVPVHTGQSEPNEASCEKYDTQIFYFFCNAPSYEVIKHLSQDQETGCKECCSPSGAHQLTGLILSKS